MALIVNRVKLSAAAGSMHQFCSTVRNIFPTPPSDEVVEAATVFLYLQVAREVFGGRFATRLRAALRPIYKFASAPIIDSCVVRIERELEDRHAMTARTASLHMPGDAFARSVANAIRSLIVSAGLAAEPDEETLRASYPRFEEAVRSVKRHLQGIHDQSGFILRR